MKQTDALGRELHVGEDVAYVSRQGSNVTITRRVITDLRVSLVYSRPMSEAQLDGSTSWARTYNMVRIT